MGGRPEKGAGAGRTQSLRRLCFPPSKGDCGLPNPSCKSDSGTQLPPTRVAWGSGQPVLELGACRSPTCVPSRAPHPHPAGSCCQPIPAGSLPAQVTRGVLGETEEGPARAQMPPGVCCQPPGSGARLPRARWAGEGPAQLRAVRARTKGRSVPREESAGIRRRRAERGDRSWAGGRLLGGAAGRARSTSPPPPLPHPRLRRSCWPGRWHRRRGRPTFGRCRRGPSTAHSAWQGQARPHARPPAATSCSGNAANGAGALGVGRARGAGRGGGGGGRGGASLGAGLGRGSAAPSPALRGSAQHPNEEAGCRRTFRQLSGMNSRL